MYCGKQLKEGENCTCPESMAESTKTSALHTQAEEKQEQANINLKKPILSKEEPVMEQEQPVMEQVQPMMQQEQPVMEQVQSLMQQEQPVMEQVQPMMQQGQAMMNQSQPMMQQGQAMNNQMQGQSNMQFEQMKQKSGVFLSDTLKAFFAILKSPVTAGTTFVKEGNYITSIGLVVLQALFTAFYGCIVCSYVNKIFRIGYFSDAASIHLFLAFLLTFIGSCIMSAARTGLLTLGTMICKGNADWKKNLCLCGARATIVSAFIVISMIITILNPGYGFLVFLISSIAGMAFALPLVTESLGVDKDKTVYLNIAVICILLLVMYLVLKVGLPLYLPKELREDGYSLRAFSNLFMQ